MTSAASTAPSAAGHDTAPSTGDGEDLLAARDGARGGERNGIVEVLLDEVVRAGAVDSGIPNSFDLYGVVSNPNQTLGSPKFNYQFTVKDAAGASAAKPQARKPNSLVERIEALNAGPQSLVRRFLLERHFQCAHRPALGWH